MEQNDPVSDCDEPTDDSLGNEATEDEMSSPVYFTIDKSGQVHLGDRPDNLDGSSGAREPRTPGPSPRSCSPHLMERLARNAGHVAGAAVGQTGALEEPARSIRIEELRDPQRWQEEIERAAARHRSRKRRMAELKKRHWETWSVVKRAVDHADPEGLLAMFSPRDEYDDAVVYLTDGILGKEHISPESLSHWFRTQYGSEPDADAIRLILGSLEAILPAP